MGSLRGLFCIAPWARAVLSFTDSNHGLRSVRRRIGTKEKLSTRPASGPWPMGRVLAAKGWPCIAE